MKEITKGKRIQEANYQKLKALLDDKGKEQLIEVIKGDCVCELKQQQVLDNGGQTMTLKFWFTPAIFLLLFLFSGCL